MKSSIAKLSRQQILSTKERFNTFFRDELYGKFRDDENIILSRGSWNDDYVRLPAFFTFCLQYTLKKQWVGYSHSLGHENTLSELLQLVNGTKKSHRYTVDNLALTIGNSLTLGMVFKQLRATSGDQPLLALTPYYPPIIKSISHHFKTIYTTSSLQSEEMLIASIRESITARDVKILFLSNGIGVEGRTFSREYWKEIIALVDKHNVILVIDEGDSFSPLSYPDEINHQNIVRVVSVSKRLGTPGMKLGYLLGGTEFIKAYYDTASTNYGGPLSAFFLLSEFLYAFEFVRQNPRETKTLRGLSDLYEIPSKKITALFENYLRTNQHNEKRFKKNYALLESWVAKNAASFEEVYAFGGINVFLKPKKTPGSCHALFSRALTKHGVSIMPSACLGDESDSYIRITILEPTQTFEAGLRALEAALADFTK